MNTRSVWLIAGLTCAAGCRDTLGPVLMGRWAAPGIELSASVGRVDLRLPCTSRVRARGLVPFTRDRIAFSGRVSEMFFQYDFTFEGHFVGDTLVATLTRSSFDPQVSTYRMTSNGDSGLDRQICAF